MSLKWEIIGAPYDGGTCQKGSKIAPTVIRKEGLTRRIEHLSAEGFSVVDGGDVEMADFPPSDVSPKGVDNLPIYATGLIKRVNGSLHNGSTPIIIGGDHSISIATVSAVAGHVCQTKASLGDVGVVWIDAHPDLEPPGPDSTDGLNAMAATHLLGQGFPELCRLEGFSPKVKPENFTLIGLRDVITEERHLIRDMGIKAYAASDVERLGIASIIDSTLESMADRVDGLVVSFDIDVIDPIAAPAVDYPEPGGLTVREAMVIAESISQFEKLSLVELVEVNPIQEDDFATSRLAARWISRVVSGPVV